MRRRNPLTEVPVEGGVSSEYFFRMMSPGAIKLVKNYLRDEHSLVEKTIEKVDNPKEYNLVAVAGGQLWLIDIGLEKTKSYTCIEPLADLYIGNQIQYLIKKNKNIRVIKKRLADTSKKDLPEGKNIFVFTFNILAYIENPIREINDLIKHGDILFISTWNTTPKARKIRTRYFNFLNSFEKEVIIDPNNTIGICDLKAFPFDKLKFPQTHKYTKTDVVEALEIKLK